jgi:DNA-binding transcriptional LysR family regulator
MLDQRLSHVVAVAKSGSFSKAAELVGVTQSAVTKSVADLEGELGYAIFHRTSRGVLLTENSKDFVERASRLLDDARLLLKGSITRGDPYGGVLRIGISPASIEFLLIEPLGILLCRHPTIRVEVTASSSERMVPHLRNGGIDVGVGFEATRGQKHVIYRLTPQMWTRGAVPGYGPEPVQ